MGDHVLFFYGTLMAPQVLHRVIHGRVDPEPWQKATLRFQPAELQGYRRHRVRGAEYPGIVPSPGSTVLGTLVSGLTDGDVYRLDRYEGSEYAHEDVKVRTLDAGNDQDGSKEIKELKAALEASGANIPIEGNDGNMINAVVYIWTEGMEYLEEAEWDFETFRRDKLAWWVKLDERDW